MFFNIKIVHVKYALLHARCWLCVCAMKYHNNKISFNTTKPTWKNFQPIPRKLRVFVSYFFHSLYDLFKALFLLSQKNLIPQITVYLTESFLLLLFLFCCFENQTEWLWRSNLAHAWQRFFFIQLILFGNNRKAFVIKWQTVVWRCLQNI